jgi:hypothetical protein
MKFKLYGIIVLICFTLLIIVYFINNKEGLSIYDYRDYTKIDRIKNSSDQYAYCIAGNVTCKDSTLNQIKDNYSHGITYNFLCENNKNAECEGNFVKNMNNVELMNWKTPTARQISFPFSSIYKGFTETYPSSYIPVKIEDKYMNFYDSSGDLIDNINKCEMLNSQFEIDDCNALNQPDTTDSSTRCIANFGTNVGDPLCCGQKGVLQNYASDYVCPKNKPTCSNYVCGGPYGTCK